MLYETAEYFPIKSGVGSSMLRSTDRHIVDQCQVDSARSFLDLVLLFRYPQCHTPEVTVLEPYGVRRRTGARNDCL
jgi:hypothetical protein